MNPRPVNVLICCCLALLGTGVVVPQAESAEYCRDSWWGHGPPRALAMDGNLLALGSGAAVELFELTDSGLPEKVGEISLPDAVDGIELRSGRAFVAADEAGLRIVDIRDPYRPMEIGSLATPPRATDLSRARDVAVSDNLALLADNGLRIVDISDQTAPQERSHLPGTTLRLDVQGRLAYLVDGAQLSVVSFSSAQQPTVAGSLALNALDVRVRDHLAYVAAGEDGLRIVDVSTPSDPVEVGSLATPGSAFTVAVQDDIAYVIAEDRSAGSISAALILVDIADPTSPQQLRESDLGWPGDDPGWGEHVAVSALGSKIYVAAPDRGLRVYTRFGQLPPFNQITIRTPGPATDVAVINQKAVVVDDRYGMHVIDLTQPIKPVVSRLELFERRPGGCPYADHGSVATDGRYAYITESCRPGSFRGMLHVVDLLDPGSPIEVGSLQLEYSVVDLGRTGTTLYLVTELPGRLVPVDVSDPETPALVGSPFGASTVHGLHIEGGRLYATSGSSQDPKRVQIYNISNPYDPILLSTVDLEGDRFAGVTSSNGTIFTVDYRTTVTGAQNPTGLHVIERAGGPSYAEVAFIALPDSGYDTYDIRSVAVGEHHLWTDTADPLLTAGGVTVFDISVPTAPEAEAFVDVPEPLRSVAVIGTRAVIAADVAGLQVVSPCARTPRQLTGRGAP